MIIKQATNYTRTFLMVQSSDHITPSTGLAPIVNISKNGGAFAASANSPATEISKGYYKILLSIVDTGTAGDLGINCTSTSTTTVTDPTDFIDQVQAQWFPDLSLDANGNIGVKSNIKKNTALTGFMFTMNSTAGTPSTGLAVTAFRALDGGSFSASTNSTSITELANGWYSVNLSAADVNGNNVALRFIATGASDTDLAFITQP